MLNNGDERNSDDKRKNDGERNNDDSVRTSFTDAELDNALAGFEREFKEESQENLKNLDGNEPEEAVQKFVDFFRGMDVMLITNRADKLTAKVYEYNCEPQEIVAPMALAVWSRTVEDLAIGMETVETISKQNIEMFNSDDLSDANAYELFQKYGKRK